MASENLLNQKNRMFSFLKKELFPNAVIHSSLENYLKTIPEKNCFIVASKRAFLAKKEELEKILPDISGVYFLTSEPRSHHLQECSAKVKSLNPKFILALGGGSVIDLAKAVKKESGLELVAIPTTPGTGSEVTPFSVFCTEQQEKEILNHPSLLPEIVVLDPSLLKTIPQELLKNFIVDLIGHALESFSSKFANPISDSLAMDAFRKTLQQAKRKVYDDEFYAEIQTAGLLAGIAQGSAYTGLAHSFAHYFGPKYNIPHGKALSYFLREVTEFNLEDTTLQQKFGKQGITKEKLLQDLGEIFKLLEIAEEKIVINDNFNFDEAAQRIRKDICTLTNPVLPTEEQVKFILKQKVEIKVEIILQKSKTDLLLEQEPYSLAQKEKEGLFLEAMRESLQRHYEGNELFRKFLISHNYDPSKNYSLEEIPYLPITLFKELELITGEKEDIKGVIRSSATTSHQPSIIALDDITMKRQQMALRKIMSSFLGEKRRAFIIFDSKATVEKNGVDISSRASAIRGMTLFAKSMKFILNENLEFDQESWHRALSEIKGNEEICFFGFTWLIYKAILKLKETGQDIIVQNTIKKLNADRKILHIGGWKKLTDISIDKEKFNENVCLLLNSEIKNVIDFYGMTEQLGTVYPDCEYGYKHLPAYSEIIIRDLQTLQPADAGKIGFIQLITPIPHSYPGISILTEDLGEIAGVDDCLCGRKGKYFLFRKRVEKAPIKGCGDAL